MGRSKEYEVRAGKRCAAHSRTDLRTIRRKQPQRRHRLPLREAAVTECRHGNSSRSLVERSRVSSAVKVALRAACTCGAP
eukprot:1550375-Pleurochrysis_carterae.AAC.4